MRRLRNIFLIKLVFLLVIFSLFTTDPGFVYGGNSRTPVLARVEVAGMLADLGLPVYAHLQDAAGKDYALVIASHAQLDQAGVRYRILDKNARKADYFIITMFPINKRVPVDKLNNVLLDDGAQVIIRSTFKQAATLAESGIDVTWLGHTPMVLAVTPQPEASVLAVEYDAIIDQMINQVTQTKVDTYVRNLSGENPVTIGGSSYTITTRHTASGTPIEKATQYVYEFMQGYGLAVSYHDWSDFGYTGRNVIGELEGTTQPDEIVLITAHLDCMPSGSIAPGADDNASGSVGVMVSAELLSQQQFKRTVRFVVFTGEEQWLLGSAAYSDMVYQAGDNITAVYNMDMISYDGTGGPDLRLHTRITSNPGYPEDLAIANTFVDVVNTYNLEDNLSPIIDADGITQSDHSSFWNNGYPAILGIEEHDYDISPYYHTTSDTVSTLNLTYFTNFVKAAVGTAAHLAILDDGTLNADFTASPTSGQVPLVVYFTDQSTNGPTSWEWTFEGGTPSTSTAQNPMVTYNTAGNYDVTLTVTNSSSSDTEIKLDYITSWVPQPPVADFSASSTSISVGDSVTFTDQSTNNPTSWDWTFEGGTPGSSTAQSPTITYNTAGTYTVTLTATNAQGSDTETKTDYINVSDIPYCTSSGNSQSYEYIAGVSVGDLNNSSGASPYTDFTNLVAHLTQGEAASVSLTPGFTGSSYTEWWRIWIDYNGDHDFEDTGEQVFSGSGSSVVSGSFTVPTSSLIGTTRMRVSMSYSTYPPVCGTFTYGEVEDYTVQISGSTPQPPVANFTASDTSIQVGDSVTFTDQSTNNPTSWSWTFEGGTPSGSSSQNPTIQYNTEGTFDVSLTAANSAGSDNETKFDYITVTSATQPPVAAFTGSPTTVTVGGSVSFTDQSTNNPTAWSWVFEGGTPSSSTSQNPTVQYNTVGTFDVTLTAYNSAGSDAELKTDYITVNAVPQPPVAAFTGSPTTVTVGGSVNFTDQSTNNPTSWSWTFEGGTPSSSTSQNPTIQYNIEGTFDVSLTATNSSGSDNETKIDYITVTAAPADEIAEAVDNGSLTFTKSGNADWYRVTDVYYYGGDSARSGAIGNNQSTTIETDVTVGSDQAVKFYWKVSSEAGYDYLRFYIDGVEKTKIAGSVDWTQVAYNISAGTHTLKWSYIKDTYVASGYDCGWVDKLEITDPVADQIAEAVDYPSLTFTLSGNGNWFYQTTTTYYGGDAAQSADISNNQSTTMETTISGKTSVKFYWKVSSEANYDYLKFYIDGVEKAKIAGDVNWTQKTYTVTSGTHTLKWSYIKDYYVSSGSDCGWVDKLELQ